MRRREALRLLGAGTALTLGGTAAANGDTPFEPLGQLEIEGAKEAVVGEEGTVYLAVTDGFAVVDVSDPSSPTLRHENRSVLADRDDGPLGGIYDVKVDGDRLAVAGPANAGPTFAAAVVYDVSDPAAPERVSVHETEFFNHNCDIGDGVVALCGNDGDRNPLVTVDAETGEELGRWSVVDAEPGWADVPFGPWQLHDVTLSDGTAYLAYWDAGTWMVDVSEPSTPELVGKVRGEPVEEYTGMASDEASEATFQPPGNDHYAAPNDDGTLVCISAEAWDIEPEEEDVRPGSLYLYDVSDPSDPTELAEIAAPRTTEEGYGGTWTTSHNFEISGETLVSSWYRGGVRIYDIADPTTPILLASWRDDERTSFWTAQHATDEFFIASSRGEPGPGAEADASTAALYTFPLPDAAVTGRPGNATATPTPTPGSPPNATATATPTPADGSTPTDTATATATPTPVDGSTPTDTATPGQPGFGAVATLAALGVGAWRLLDGRDE
jgi:hypothetical protein